jgi:hypothetical protein
MIQPINLAKRNAQSVPLRRILIAPLSDGQWIRVGSVVAPETEFRKGGLAGEEVEEGANDGSLVGIEFYTGESGYMCCFDVEVF